MSRSRTVALLAGVMALIATAAVGVTALLLYETAIDEQTARLQDLVAVKADMVEAVAEYDATAEVPRGFASAQEATLSQIRDAHARHNGLGETGEFTLARRQGDRIHFLLSLRHGGEGAPRDVAFGGPLAEPMHRALEGETGVMQGRDYRGVAVLAAYRPIPILDAGMVAKIDLAEVRRPFIQAVAAAFLVLSVLVLFGSILLARVIAPLAREGEERGRSLENLVASLSGAAYRCRNDRYYTMEYISDRVETITGVTAAEFLAGEVSYGTEVVHPDDRERVWREVQDAVHAGRGFRLAYRIVRRDGGERFVREQGVPVPAPEGGPLLLEGYVEDVTREHESEAAMLRLNRALRTVGDCNAAVIRATTEQDLCAEMCRILVEEGQYPMAWIALHRGPGEGWLARCSAYGKGTAHADAVIGGTPAGDHLPGEVMAAGVPRYIADLARDTAYRPWAREARELGFGAAVLLPLVGSGEPLGVMGLYATHAEVFDAEQLKLLAGLADDLAFGLEARRALGALRESEGRLRSVLDSSADALIVVDGQGTVTFANHGAVTLFDREHDQLVGGQFGQAATPGTQFMVDIIHGSGGVRRAEAKAAAVTWQGRSATLVSLRDVTERERLIAEQHRQRELLQNILDNIPAQVSWCDREGIYLGGNRAFAAAAGLPDPGAVAGRTLADLPWEPAERERNRQAASEVMASGEATMGQDETLHLADGRVVDLLVSRAPLRDVDGVIYGILVIGVDITERREAERRLQQAQKMEAVGNLTGGIAHDFNNLLGVVMGNLQLIERLLAREDANPRVAERLATALDAVGRGADLTRRLLAFSRRQVLEPRIVDMNGLVDGMERLLARTLGEAIEIRVSADEALWPVALDPGQLESALLNLAVNARDAMPGGGQLAIETANVVLDEHYAADRTYAAPGEYAMLAVTDTGTGMPPEVLEQVFEPFFTTKEAGKGTGLGLSMVYGFVKQSKGLVNIYSEPDHGTTVKLYFPRSPDEVEQLKDRGSEEEAVGGDEALLVVEDNAELRETVTAYLRTLGYAVKEAGSAEEALEALAAGDGVALLFTDLVMPGGKNGAELAVEARHRLPGLRVLFTSGYARDALASTRLKDLEAEFLSKPYRLEDLGRTVRRCLDGG